MASSNRHWPSMFRSKPCNSSHQWQHDINSSLVSNGCNRPPCTSVPGCEERSPEPKPRWNPKPEQIRILEAIFNSGMVNPPRDEIRKIRAQLQEYGQVGDANVFYWFQNRKSRSKHKLRNLHNSKQQSQLQTQQAPPPLISGPSSSSSSSEKSSPKGSINKRSSAFTIGSSSIVDISNSPTGSVNQTYFQTQGDFLQEAFFFPVQQQAANFTQGFYFSDLSNVVHQVPEQQTVGPCTSLLLNEIMNHGSPKKERQLNCYSTVTTPTLATTYPSFVSSTTIVTVPSTVNQPQGFVEPVGGQMGPVASVTRSLVKINDVEIEVGVGPFNVREAFGDDALLLNSSGQPVLTNEFGVTLHPLQHGASYHLISLKQCQYWGSPRENVEDNLIL